MTIIEAVKSGGNIRRRKTKHEVEERIPGEIRPINDGWMAINSEGYRVALNAEDITAVDWEVQMPCKMLSAEDIRKAWDRIRGNNPCILASEDAWILNPLFKELGL